MNFDKKHKYVVSSERAYRRSDEAHVTIWSDAKWEVGDELKVGGIIWTIEEVVK